MRRLSRPAGPGFPRSPWYYPRCYAPRAAGRGDRLVVPGTNVTDGPAHRSRRAGQPDGRWRGWSSARDHVVLDVRLPVRPHSVRNSAGPTAVGHVSATLVTGVTAGKGYTKTIVATCRGAAEFRFGCGDPVLREVKSGPRARKPCQVRCSTSAVSSPPASPVLTTLLGSKRSSAVSVSARGQCSVPFDTTKSSPGASTTSRSRN